MTIERIGSLPIKALENASYNESSVSGYRGVPRRFNDFCNERGITEYSSVIEAEYANATISPKTGKYSAERHSLQMRFIGSYKKKGVFVFGEMKRGRVKPTNINLMDEYENENTLHYYEYGMYRLVQFMDETGAGDIKSRVCLTGNLMDFPLTVSAWFPNLQLRLHEKLVVMSRKRGIAISSEKPRPWICTRTMFRFHSSCSSLVMKVCPLLQVSLHSQPLR